VNPVIGLFDLVLVDVKLRSLRKDERAVVLALGVVHIDHDVGSLSCDEEVLADQDVDFARSVPLQTYGLFNWNGDVELRVVDEGPSW